ncbi:MAG: hypothetical protein AAGB29_04335 [Planctomycetota bacterium]
MPDWVYTSLGIVGLLIVLAYLGLPFVVWQSFKFDVNQLTEIDPDEDFDDLWADDSSSLSGMRRSLSALGFSEVARCTGALVSNVDTVFSMMVSPCGNHLAFVSIVVPKANTMGAMRYVDFSSEFLDGREINTQNTSVSPSAQRDPDDSLIWLPEVQDVPLLWQVHLAHVARQERGTKSRAIPLDRDPIEFMKDEMSREFTKKSARGIYKEVEPGVYCLTLKGAFSESWGELPPFKQLRRRRFHRRSLELLREVQRRPA